MKEKLREIPAPIKVAKHDVLHVDYVDENGKKTRVANYAFEESRTITDIVIAELEKHELEPLGLKSALAAILGEKASALDEALNQAKSEKAPEGV